MRCRSWCTATAQKREAGALRREVESLRRARGEARSDEDVEAEGGEGPSLSRAQLWREVRQQHACIAALEEALARCTSSLVARQLAEDERSSAVAQLDRLRAEAVG